MKASPGGISEFLDSLALVYHYSLVPLSPIVERELRVASHQARTWWRRVAVAGVAVGLFFFVYFAAGRVATPANVGRQLVAVLGGFAMVYALTLGPLTTSDALSSEQREGTLGLLFLTNLRSQDVVLGKLAAGSFDMVLCFLAGLPLMAVPFLMGGLDLERFAWLMLAVLDLGFLSMAAGIFFSSATASGRKSLALTVVFLVILTLVIPWTLDEMFRIGPSSKAAPFTLMFCPLYTMEQTLGGPVRNTWALPLNLAAMFTLGGALILGACTRARSSWRREPESVKKTPYKGFKEWMARGSLAGRRQRRALWLNSDPVRWLESRERTQQRLLWFVTLSACAIWMLNHLDHPLRWPNMDDVILWPLFAHWVLCGWLAIDAPRRLADDKHSGALELLLCTPTSPCEILQGNTRALIGKFGGPALLLALLFAYGFFVYSDRANQFQKSGLFSLGLAGMLVVPVQAWAFLRTGIYRGLLYGNSLRATIWLIAVLGVIPWALFAALMVTLSSSSIRVAHETITVIWVLIHLGICGSVLAQAESAFHYRFRLLASIHIRART